jgi:DNA-binding NtrC family response regulator
MQRVLVVDDERLTADTLGIIFSKKGYNARVAYTVEDALVSVAEFSPNLILCDITMPGRNGLELMVEIGRRDLDCGVLILTGYLTNLKPVRDQIRRMTQRTQVLTKPCPPEELLRAAGQMLAVGTIA